MKTELIHLNKNIDYLKDQLERFGLRRTKDILDLPPKTIIDEYIDMDEDQSEFYDNIIIIKSNKS